MLATAGNRNRALAVRKSANNWLVMTSKNLQNRMKSVGRMDAQLKQLALRLDQAKKALGVDERRERVGELCDIGGDFLSVGLGRLKPNERLGAFMILAEMVESESFLEECRSRAAAEMARRQMAKDAKDGWKRERRRKRREPEVEVESIEQAPVRSAPVVAPIVPTPEAGLESLVVRFSGPITDGKKLRALGLTYDRASEQWTGEANRAAVEAEIKVLSCARLLKEIISLGASTPAAASAPATTGWWPQLRNGPDLEVEVEDCEELPRRRPGPE